LTGLDRARAAARMEVGKSRMEAAGRRVVDVMAPETAAVRCISLVANLNH
jgi:hypothetical protein